MLTVFFILLQALVVRWRQEFWTIEAIRGLNIAMQLRCNDDVSKLLQELGIFNPV